MADGGDNTLNSSRSSSNRHRGSRIPGWALTPGGLPPCPKKERERERERKKTNKETESVPLVVQELRAGAALARHSDGERGIGGVSELFLNSRVLSILVETVLGIGE